MLRTRLKRMLRCGSGHPNGSPWPRKGNMKSALSGKRLCYPENNNNTNNNKAAITMLEKNRKKETTAQQHPSSAETEEGQYRRSAEAEA